MFPHSVKLISIDGFDIKLDPSWSLIAVLMTWSLSRFFFPSMVPGQTSPTYLVMGLVAMLGFFISLLLHELAHAVIARRYGLTIKGITLFVFGGVAELDEQPTRPRIEFWVALAGPMMSLCLAFGFWVTGSIAELIMDNATLAELFSYLA